MLLWIDSDFSIVFFGYVFIHLHWLFIRFPFELCRIIGRIFGLLITKKVQLKEFLVFFRQIILNALIPHYIAGWRHRDHHEMKNMRKQDVPNFAFHFLLDRLQVYVQVLHRNRVLMGHHFLRLMMRPHHRGWLFRRQLQELWHASSSFFVTSLISWLFCKSDECNYS